MDSFLALFILGLSLTLTHGVPSEDSAPLSREKRAVFPFVLGQTILDIQCQAGAVTVCAPDGPAACPTNYNTIGQKGACGFATLQRYLSSGEVSGTCCVFNPSAVASTTSASATSTGVNIILPQIVAYPVYAQYPFATSNTASNVVNTGSNTGSYGGSSYGGSSAGYGK